jgi:hypothetical protein
MTIKEKRYNYEQTTQNEQLQEPHVPWWKRLRKNVETRVDDKLET